jgi:hypothetical protein
MIFAVFCTCNVISMFDAEQDPRLSRKDMGLTKSTVQGFARLHEDKEDLRLLWFHGMPAVKVEEGPNSHRP